MYAVLITCTNLDSVRIMHLRIACLYSGVFIICACTLYMYSSNPCSCHLLALISQDTDLLWKLMISLHQVHKAWVTQPLWMYLVQYVYYFDLLQVLGFFLSDARTTTNSFKGLEVILQAALSLVHLIQTSCNFSVPQVWINRRAKKTR